MRSRFEAFQPLAYSIARKFFHSLRRYGFERRELVTVALAGLFDAARLRPTLSDAEFVNYAWVRIWGHVVDDIRRQSELPRRWHGRIASGEMARVFWEEFSAQENATHERWRQQNHYGVDAEAQQVLLDAERDRRIAALVAELPSRERDVVLSHFFAGQTHRAIAERLGVSEPRVSQLSARAIRRIRERV